MRTRSRPLWLCLDFPRLPLEALPGGAGPRAVYEEQRGVRQVLLASREAGKAGIQAGMPVTAALALLPALTLQERDPARERRTLEALAAWAECYTSRVSLDPPALLLEIAGSLRLFGGLDTLWRRITRDLGQRGFTASQALAPTPLAARLLARGGGGARIEDPKHLTGAVAALPLACLAWPEEVMDALRGMGLTTIGDCLRLPRQGFLQRFGAAPLLDLDRALGRLPDPRASHRQPERFSRECELSGEIDDSGILLEACRQLLKELERFLVQRQVAVRAVRFTFFHLRAQATRLEIGRRQAGGGVEQWSRLLALRFESLDLPEPVIAIRLAARDGEPLRGTTASLPFHGRTGRAGEGCAPVVPMADLVERLGARLGPEAVHGLALAAEHRPQRAWRPALPAAERLAPRSSRSSRCLPEPPDDYRPHWLGDSSQAGRLLLKRPLWMLPEPLPLRADGEAPSCDGPLTLLSGPERIETGWWDDESVARDYFVAADARGSHLWIFRDRSRGGWYLHGMFG